MPSRNFLYRKIKLIFVVAAAAVALMSLGEEVGGQGRY